MHETWQSLLEYTGAQLHGGRVRFGEQDSETPPCPASFVTLLPQFTVLRVSGTDAAGFLQGQLTCDVDDLQEGGGTLCAWCNPKGRVITTLILHRLGGEFLLLLPTPLAETVLRKLGMYILRADVQLSAVSDRMPVLGQVDSGAGVAGGLQATAQEYGYRLELPAGMPARRLFLAEPGAGRGVWDQLRLAAPAADGRCWDRLDIEAGIPWLDAGTSEQFLPQELNLDHTRGLSFTKGCFPGQEVIARLRHRGRVKRRLYRLQAEPGVTAENGERLQDSHAGNMGVVIAASRETGDAARVLAVLDSGRTAGEIAYRSDGSMLHIDSGSVPAGVATE